MSAHNIEQTFQELTKQNAAHEEAFLKLVKKYNKKSEKLDLFEQIVKNQEERLNKLLKEEENIKNSIDKSCEILISTNVNIMELQEELKNLTDKYNTLEENIKSKLVSTNVDDLQMIYLKKNICLKLIKLVTKVFIDANTSSTLIRGFAGNHYEKSLFPFELCTTKISEKELIDEMWEMSKKTSSFTDTWKKLFQL